MRNNFESDLRKVATLATRSLMKAHVEMLGGRQDEWLNESAPNLARAQSPELGSAPATWPGKALSPLS